MPSETVDKLNDSNYANWHIKMEALLDEKELWDLVSGDETMPLSGPNSKAVKTFKQKQRLAHAKIILHVENSQFPYTQYNDPKEILAQVHQSWGFGTLLTICHCFFSMVKKENQSMQAWIASIHHAAFELEAADFQIQDIDLIIALTQGLPESYSSLIISLDGTPPDQLNINTPIIHLLNEEACQLGPTTHTIISIPKVEFSDNIALYVSSRASQKGPSLHNTRIRCFNCWGRGHLAKTCPSPKASDTEAAYTAWMIDNIGNDGTNDDEIW
jgi:gag-polypeptide of LTR copia-type/Domain of unknown function (DUF4219)